MTQCCEKFLSLKNFIYFVMCFFDGISYYTHISFTNLVGMRVVENITDAVHDFVDFVSSIEGYQRL